MTCLLKKLLHAYIHGNLMASCVCPGWFLAERNFVKSLNATGPLSSTNAMQQFSAIHSFTNCSPFLGLTQNMLFLVLVTPSHGNNTDPKISKGGFPGKEDQTLLKNYNENPLPLPAIFHVLCRFHCL